MKYIFCILILILFSCNNIETKDLLIIDNVQLGQNVKDFYISIDKLGIKNEPFFTKYFYTEDELKNSTLSQFYYSEVFNLTRSKELQEHYGLYYLTTAGGTENVIGLTLLLGHTTNPKLLSNNYGMIDITDTYKKRGFYQEVYETLIQEYISMFMTKYGEPMSDVTTDPNNFYVTENNNVEKYRTPKSDNGRYILWETDEMTIGFFTGIKSSRTEYHRQFKSYMYSMDQSSVKIPNQSYEQCYSFPYITYQLKRAVVEKLKLDKPKI
jgi:hypothetical protein